MKLSKALKNIAAVVLRFCGLPVILREIFAKEKTTILVYHDPSAEVMRKHLAYLTKKYNFVSLDEFVHALGEHNFEDIPQKSLVISFDDGHKGNYDLLEAFEEYSIKPTIFLASSIVGTSRHFWWKELGSNYKEAAGKLKKMSNTEREEFLREKYGFEKNKEYPQDRQALSREEIAKMKEVCSFGSHSRSHPILTACSDDESHEEIFLSKSEVESITGEECRHFAYPNGDYSPREIRNLREAGYFSGRSADSGFNAEDADPMALKVLDVADDASVSWMSIQASGIVGWVKSALRRMGRHEKDVVKGTGVAFLGIFFFNLVSALTLLAKTHLMSAGDVGLLALAKSIVLTAFVLTNGFSAAVFRYASLFRGESSQEKIKGVVSVAYKYAVPIFFLVLIFVEIFAGSIATQMFKKPELTVLIRVLSVMVFFKVIMDLNVALLRSKYLVQYRYILDIALQLLMLGGVLVLFVLGKRDFLLMFAVSWALAAAVVMVHSFVLVRKHFTFLYNKALRTVEQKKRMFVYAFITQFTNMLVRFRLEFNVFIMGFFLHSSQIALYNVAFQMGMAAGILLEGLNSIFPAVVGRLYGQDNVSEIKRLHKRAAITLLGISTFIFLGFLFFGKYILWIFGDYYKDAYVPLLIIAFSFIVESGVGSAGRILNMMGKPHYNTANTFVALILTIALCYTLIPIWGVSGAAAAFAISNIVKRLMMLGGVMFLYRKNGQENTTV